MTTETLQTDSSQFRSRYKQFLDEAAAWTRSRLVDPAAPQPPTFRAALDALLEHFAKGRDLNIAAKALANPFFPAGMLWRGWLERGYRFKYPARSELTPQQVVAEKGLRHLILLEEFKEYKPGEILSVPFDGPPVAGAFPEGQWCDFCGMCCACFGGVNPMAPKHTTYPAHWLDDLWQYQYWCPFLFEYHWTGRFFCSIHRIKPMWCDDFADREICGRVKQGFGL